MICLLVGTGIYLTIRLGGVQFRHLGHAVDCIRGRYDREQDEGDVSHFRALTTALAATIGVGNIAGVATAIVMGGPGAVFWMWMTAVVGMATKFSCCSLALHFRRVHADGSVSGGPMYYLEKAFRPAWLMRLAGEDGTRRIARVMAIMFATFTVVASFGIGNMVQANSVMGGAAYILPRGWQTGGFAMPVPWGQGAFQITWFNLIGGLVMLVLTALVIIGGIKRIGSVTARFVPVMCVFYVAGSLCVLVLYAGRIPECLALIFREAFSLHAAGGGTAGMLVAMRFGVARGVFSNESGLGSAPIAHAAAKTPEMIREGFVAMLEPFIDTLIICSMTALVILVTDARTSGPDLDGSMLTAHAFEKGLFGFGHYVVGVGLVLFAYSTIIGWSYYGDRCAEYLFGPRAVDWYRYLYLALIVVGAVGGLRVMWALADIFNALMAVPNLIALIALAGLLAAKKRDYVRRLGTGEFDKADAAAA
jgi:AGCS family alanine or glycine:cation symporter